MSHILVISYDLIGLGKVYKQTACCVIMMGKISLI